MDRRGKIQLGQFCWHARNQYLLFCSVKYLLLGFRLDLPNLNSIRRLRFFFRHFGHLRACTWAPWEIFNFLEIRRHFSIYQFLWKLISCVGWPLDFLALNHLEMVLQTMVALQLKQTERWAWWWWWGLLNAVGRCVKWIFELFVAQRRLLCCSCNSR